MKKFLFFFSDDFYKNDDECEDEDDFVEVSTTDSNLWSKDGSGLSKLLSEDSIGQLNAVHNKYHQLKCQYHASRKFKNLEFLFETMV